MASVKPLILENGEVKTAGTGDQVPQSFVEGLTEDLGGLHSKVDSLDEHLHEDLDSINNTIHAMSAISLRLENTTTQRFASNSGQTQLQWSVKSQSNLVSAVEAKTNEVEFKVTGNFLFNTDFQVARTNANAPTKFKLILKDGSTILQEVQLESPVAPGDNVHLSVDTLVEATEGMNLTVFIQPTNGSTGDLSIQRLDSYMVSQSIGSNLQIVDATTNVKGVVKYGTEEGTAAQGNDPRLSDARPASDVYPWAKEENKPEYSSEEIEGLGTAATRDVGTSPGDLVTMSTLVETVQDSSAQLPSSEVYIYGENGSLEKVESSEGDTIITYNEQGSVSSVEYPSGRIETYTYTDGVLTGMTATEV